MKRARVVTEEFSVKEILSKNKKELITRKFMQSNCILVIHRNTFPTSNFRIFRNWQTEVNLLV